MVESLCREHTRQVGQLKRVLDDVVHLYCVLVVLELTEQAVLLAQSPDAGVRVVPSVLALAVKLLAALRQVVQVVLDGRGAGVAAGPGLGLPRVLHQEAVPALNVRDVGEDRWNITFY